MKLTITTKTYREILDVADDASRATWIIEPIRDAQHGTEHITRCIELGCPKMASCAEPFCERTRMKNGEAER